MSYSDFWRWFGTIWMGIMWLILLSWLGCILIKWLKNSPPDVEVDEPHDIEEWEKEEEI